MSKLQEALVAYGHISASTERAKAHLDREVAHARSTFVDEHTRLSDKFRAQPKEYEVVGGNEADGLEIRMRYREDGVVRMDDDIYLVKVRRPVVMISYLRPA